MKLGPNQTKWLEALESGDFEQGKAYLCKDGKHCVLGVAAEIFGNPEDIQEEGNYKTYDGHSSVPPEYVEDKLSFSFSAMDNLMNENDSGKSFESIAESVRKSPQNFFKESK